MLNGYLPEKCKWSIYNVDLIDLHRRFLVRISRQIAQMDCLTAYFLDQFGIDYREIRWQSFDRYEEPVDQIQFVESFQVSVIFSKI